MSPLDPRLKELLRRHANNRPASSSPPPGFVTTVLARRHRDAVGSTGNGLDQLLLCATALSLLVIAVFGVTLAYQSGRQATTSTSWVTASQFAASRFMP